MFWTPVRETWAHHAERAVVGRDVFLRALIRQYPLRRDPSRDAGISAVEGHPLAATHVFRSGALGDLA